MPETILPSRAPAWRSRIGPLLVLCWAAQGCRAPAVGPFPQASVILISVDTLRADRLPIYGYAKGSTPHLDELAKEGVVFEDVTSHYPLTLPAHAALLTGLIPPHNGVRSNTGFSLSPSHPTLATRLRRAGWKTGGAVSSFVLSRQSGIGRGFDFYEDDVGGPAPEAFNAAQRDGAITEDALGQWLERQKRARVFAFLHLYEPHSPYAPPARYARLPDPYDGEVAYTDELIGRFFDRLRALGRYDGSLIVVTADHGESLGEHGEDEHGIFLYSATLHVPLIVKLPGGRRGGTRVGGAVAQTDIAATILDLVGQPTTGLDGRSLRPAFEGHKLAERPVYSESLYPRYTLGWSELRAVTTDEYRYVRAPRPELFDRAQDPREARNLAPRQPDRVHALDAWIVKTTKDEPVPRPGQVPAQTAERLRSLGYLATSGSAVGASGLPDPKDRIAVYPKLKAAIDAYRDREWAKAIPQLRELIGENPHMMDLREMLAQSLLQSGQPQEGVAVLEDALKDDPDRPAAHLALVRLALIRGDFKEAVRHAEPAAGHQPGGGAELIATMLARHGELARALDYARKSLAADPNRFAANFLLGILERKAGHCEAALTALRRARENNPEGAVPGLFAKMGDCLATLKREDEAERMFLEELRVNPSGAEARLGLALLYWKQARPEEARAVLDQWLAAVPYATADVYWMLIRMYLQMNDVDSASAWSKIAHELFPTDKRFKGGIT